MSKYIVIHIIISIVFLVVNLKKSRDEAIYKFLVVFLLPISGVIYFAVLYVLGKTKYDSSDELVEYSEYIKNDVEKFLYSKVDVDRESNKVSMEEALVLNENKIKRRMLIDLVKEKPEDYVSIIRKALENSDTETSHYAATTIQELKKEYVNSLQQLALEHEKDRGNIEKLKAYVNVMKKYLSSNLIDENAAKKYKYIYAEKLGELLERYSDGLEYFVDRIEFDLKEGDTVSAQRYCDIFKQLFVNNEEPYLMYLKLYYTVGDIDSFKLCLKELKEYQVKFTKKALDIVRFWDSGEKNEY